MRNTCHGRAVVVCEVILRSIFDEVLDEREAAPCSIDVLAEFGIERDRSFQQDRCDGFVLEAVRAEKRFVDGRQIVSALLSNAAKRKRVARGEAVFAECDD
jgi:hypothetical protein